MGSAQSSKQQPMVETRRSSRRLQAKSEASSGSQSEREARMSPQRASSRRSPSKSPASASKSPSKRGRGRSRKQEQGEEADEFPQDIPVDEEDAASEDREQEVVEQVVEKVVEQVEQAAEAENEEQVEDEEEEDEIVMMDEEEDEEDEQDAADENDETESDDKDEDISEYAQLAAAGLDLFGTGSSSKTSSADALTTAITSKRTAEDIQRTLVPDQLDSGASLHATFFELKGSKRSGGAKLRADVRAQAEAQVIQKEQGVVAHSVRQREETRKKTAGRKWFDMESDELTPEMRRDFALLRMRNYLDPKKFYKSSDHNKKLPKHFQMGTVIEGAHEFKSARMTKKERQQTFTDEIMADDSIRQYTKRVFHQVQNSRMGRGKKKAKTNHRSF